MSAPDDAITLKEELADWPENLDELRFKCPCGYRGMAEELLVDSTGREDTMWCPVCRLSGWVWE